jgi:hypothetical protein
MERWWNGNNRVKQKVSEKNLSNFHVSTIVSTWICLGFNQGLWDQRLVTTLHKEFPSPLKTGVAPEKIHR